MKIFLCGIPASGKSIFGEGIAKSKGYVFINAEHDWPDQKLHEAWDASINDLYEIDKFVEMATDDVIIDLGFPINAMWIGLIITLKSRGYFPVWFECPVNIARERFIERKGGNIEEFDAQIERINRNRGNITKLISPISIEVLKNGNQKSSDDLFKEIEAQFHS
jgi:cytidylate kinase